MIFIYTSTALAEQEVEYPSITSPAAYVVDQKTGEVLLTKDSSSRRAVASTTKMITALLVLEKADPEAQVTISDYVASTQGGTIGLKSGEKHKVRDLLYALMLASANDAAVALAEHIGGTEEKFAEMMTERAKELGA
ncbi:MAG: D-alanyl-D-alanine carboxypeptidase, partial [Actinomycetia bacterium]|nr:D-alanyl-D-alanine carboxypeptidase [Actinomycetes bacterium]